jgi:hypothetical protein
MVDPTVGDLFAEPLARFLAEWSTLNADDRSAWAGGDADASAINDLLAAHDRRVARRSLLIPMN